MEDQLVDPEVKTTRDDWYRQASETEFGEVLFGSSSAIETEEATILEVPIDDETTTDNEAVITTAEENFAENKTSSGDVTSFNLDVSDNPYIMTLPPMDKKSEYTTYVLMLDLMHTQMFGCLTLSLRKECLKLNTE